MTAFLSPLGGAGAQFFTNQGVVLAGGKLYTYQAGTTTNQATWTTSTQSVSNANPIILDSAGRVTTEIWLQGGSTYKFVLKDSSDNTLGTWDTVGGINDANYAAFSEWVTYGATPTYVSTTSFTIAGNQTTLFQVGRRLQLSVVSGLRYGAITSSTFGGSVTTVVVNLDSGTLDSTLFSVAYGFMSATNTSLPVSVYAPIASPTFTGTPQAPTAAAGTDTTQLATTAFAMHMQSPAFTGTPTAPTATAGTNNTQLATTAFATALAFNAALPAQAGNAGKFVTTDGVTASWATVVGGGGATASGVTVLTSSSSGAQLITVTGFGQYAQLPDATTMGKGSLAFAISCVGDYDLSIIGNTGTYLGYVKPYTTANVGLADNSSAAGSWVLSGHEIIGSEVLSTVTTSSIIDTSTSTTTQTVILDSNRTLLVMFGDTCAQGIIYDSSTRTFGSPTLLATANLVNGVTTILVSTDKVLMVYGVTSTAVLTAVVLTISGSAITVNTPINSVLGSNRINLGQLTNITGGSVVGYQRSGVVTACVAITVSGTVPTFGTENIQTSTSSNFAPLIYQTSGAVCVAFSMSASLLYARPMTLSGSTLTTGTESSTSITDVNRNSIRPLASGRWGCVLVNSTMYGSILGVSGTVATFSAQVQMSTLTINAMITAQAIGSQVVATFTDGSAHHTNVLTDSSGAAVAGTLISKFYTGGSGSTSPLGVYGSEARTSLVSSAGTTIFRITISGNNPVQSFVGSTVIATGSGVFVSNPNVQAQGLKKLVFQSMSMQSSTRYYNNALERPWAFSATSEGVKLESQSYTVQSQADGFSYGSTNAEVWTCSALNTTSVQIQKLRLV